MTRFAKAPSDELDGVPVTRPSLLAVSAVPPWPLRGGFSLRAGHLLEALGEAWDIQLIVAGECDPGAAPWASDRHRVFSAPLGQPLPAFRAPVRGVEPLRRAFDEAARARTPDAVLLFSGTEFLAFGSGFPSARVSAPSARPTVVVDRIDCSTLERVRAIRRARSLRAFSALPQSLTAARHERRITRSADAVTLVGEDDAAMLRRLTGSDSVFVVRNGVHAFPAPDFELESSYPTVVFTGSLGYYANVDAVRYFVRSIWPSIRARVDGARLVLAGRNPRPSVLALGRQEGVEVRADVPDMYAILREGWVSVAPMRCGAGVKNKILEAWAVGRPTVMTPLAANGLHLDEVAGALVANDRTAFGDLVVRLLRDRELRHDQGTSLQELARTRHTWEESAETLSGLLEGTTPRT